MQAEKVRKGVLPPHFGTVLSEDGLNDLTEGDTPFPKIKHYQALKVFVSSPQVAIYTQSWW